MTKKNKNKSKKNKVGAFEYKSGSKIATVKHYNIKEATLEKREKVAAKLKKLGIRKILTNGNFYNIRKFLNLENIPNTKKQIEGEYVTGPLPARYSHKPLKITTNL